MKLARSRIWTFLLLLSCRWSLSRGLTFMIEPGERKCYSYEFPANTVIKGTLLVAHGESEMSLSIYITDPRGKVAFHSHGLTHTAIQFETISGKHGHPVSNEDPDPSKELLVYRLCANHPVVPNELRRWDVHRKVTVNLRPMLTTYEKNSIAQRKTDLDPLSDGVRQLDQFVNNILFKVSEMVALENNMVVANKATADMVIGCGVTTCLILIVIASLQTFHLQDFLRKKNII